jgi:acyl carrier protein
MEIKPLLKEFIVRNFMMGLPPQSLGDGDSLLERSIIDSTGVLELVNFLEETFTIAVEDAELLPENLDSLNALEGFVSRKLALEARP